MALSRADIEPLEKYLIAILSYRFNDVIRSPLIATCTFKINNENMRRNRARQREINRQKEIHSALNKRRERKGKMIEMEEFTTVATEIHHEDEVVPQVPQVPQIPNTRAQILEAHVRIVLSQEVQLSSSGTPQNMVTMVPPTSHTDTLVPPNTPNNSTVFFIQFQELPKVEC